MTILGINPGGKYLGLAVLRGPELRDWRVKVTKGKWSDEKYRRIMTVVTEYIDRYRPDAISLKWLHPSRSSAGLKHLVAMIIALAEKKDLKISRYGIKELESFFQADGRKNKRRMSEMIVAEFPVLHAELTMEGRNSNPYYLRMFEAVGLAAACFHDLDNCESSTCLARVFANT